MKLKLFILVALMGVSSLFVSAQTTDNGWLGLRAGYINSSIDPLTVGGVNLGMVKSWRLVKTFPLYFESGIEANWQRSSNTEDDWGDDGESRSRTYDVIDVNVPLNLAGKFQIADKLSLVPYVGLNVKAYVYGNYCYKYTYKDETKSENTNLFSDDFSYNLNRFHIGGHVGLDAHYDRFVFGFSYGGDFTKIVNPNYKVSSFKFRVGINF